MEVDGSVVKQGTSAGNITYNVGSKLSGTVTVTITARDTAGYTSSATQKIVVSGE
jgi:hypothetical protein